MPVSVTHFPGGALDPHWFRGDVEEKDEKMLEHSGKLLVTLEILDKASQVMSYPKKVQISRPVSP